MDHSMHSTAKGIHVPGGTRAKYDMRQDFANKVFRKAPSMPWLELPMGATCGKGQMGGHKGQEGGKKAGGGGEVANLELPVVVFPPRSVVVSAVTSDPDFSIL